MSEIINDATKLNIGDTVMQFGTETLEVTEIVDHEVFRYVKIDSLIRAPSEQGADTTPNVPPSDSSAGHHEHTKRKTPAARAAKHQGFARSHAAAALRHVRHPKRTHSRLREQLGPHAKHDTSNRAET